MKVKYSAGPGILLAAPKSGSGKTTVTCALLQALKDRGLRVQAFKCGPDYIDPMFHRKIIGVSSKNLDPYFCEPDQLRALYAEQAGERDIAILEGAMGLFDGLGGVSEEASAYQVAAILRLPILLVVDAHGMGRSIVPMLAGFLEYDTENLICGVVLNRVSKGFYGTIAPVIGQELSLPVLGCFPDDPTLHLKSRHLGLQLPDETRDLKGQVQKAAGMLEENVQTDQLIRMAETFCKKEDDKETERERAGQTEESGKTIVSAGEDTRIAVAMDEAFCFYYEDNFRLLEQMGAELVFFSPLHDEALPEGIGGVLFGGGYPELYARQLEENESMRRSIRAALTSDMPSLAECGGFMYLHDNLILEDGTAYQMCGVLAGDCRYTGHSVRFGYISLSEKEPCFMEEGTSIRGHEFHYFDSTANGSCAMAVKPVTGRTWDCVHATKRHWWGFPHLYYLSNEEFAAHFVAEAKKYSSTKR